MVLALGEPTLSKDASDWPEQVSGLLAQSNRAYLIALRATGQPAIAEEAVQEAFARLLEKPPADRGTGNLSGYFFTVVRGIALEMARSSRRRRSREEISATARGSHSMEDRTLNREAITAAKDALNSLPFEEQEVVGLCCEQGLGQRVAGEILSLTPQTTFKRLKRGLGKLRDVLQSQGFGAFDLDTLGAALNADKPGNDWTIIRFGVDRPVNEQDWETSIGGWKFENDGWVSWSVENVLEWRGDVPASFRFVCEGWIDQVGELSIVGHRPSPDFKNFSRYGGYFFEFGAEFNTCTKFARGPSDVLCKVGLGLVLGRKYKLEMEYHDDEGLIHCAVDGRRIFSYRELTPFPGNKVGFYAYVPGAHLRPLELHIQNQRLSVPPLRAADRLYAYGYFAEALHFYGEIAKTAQKPATALEARLKAGMCEAQLRHNDAAERIFVSMSGTPFEPYALAERALMELRGAPEDRTSAGLAFIRELQEKFPASEAKARVIEAAIGYRRERVLHGDDREQDLRVRADLLGLAAATVAPPAGTQIKCASYQTWYLLRLAAWNEALETMSTFSGKIQPPQADVMFYRGAYFAAALAGGRDDLLDENAFNFHDWQSTDWISWNTGVLLHAVVRGMGAQRFLDAYRSGRRPRVSYGWLERYLAWLVQLSTGEINSAEHQSFLKASGGDPNPVFAYFVGSTLCDARLEDQFLEWALQAQQCPHLSAEAFASLVPLMRCQFYLQAGEIDKAAGFLEGLQVHADFPLTNLLLLQILIASLRPRPGFGEPEIEHLCRTRLTGTELDLATVFTGKKDIEQVRWPHSRWRPEWRLWLALWLESRGQRTEALRIVLPARDTRYGLTHSQPAIEQLLVRLSP